MAQRGRKRRLGLEDEYWQLLADGFKTVEACRMLGIGRKTGYRWRAERFGIRPERHPEQMQSTRYLSLLERQRIASLRARQYSMREIAIRLGRAPSTISRELRRNTAQHDYGGYDGDLAHARAHERRARKRRRMTLELDQELRAIVQEKLEEEWSPEQIAGWLKTTHPARTSWHICHESIYRALYSGGAGLSRVLTRKLRSGRTLRRFRKRAHQRSTRFASPGRLIDERPVQAQERSRLGDWEGDLILGTANRSAIATLVCRRSRYVKLVHLPVGHHSAATTEAIAEALLPMPEELRRTLTWDQGSEMAAHEALAHVFPEGIYFAHAGKPWQRGSNENTNRLLRQYFPKGADLRAYSEADLRAVEERLNGRPRKMFGWRTPGEIFSGG